MAPALVDAETDQTDGIQGGAAEMMPTYGILNQSEIDRIHRATLQVLDKVGVRIYHAGILERLAEAGADVNRNTQIARMGEPLVMDSLARAGKSYVLYGRDGTHLARFGYGDLVTISTPGQFSWVDSLQRARRSPTSEDTQKAILVGDALEHITIVGAMTQPADIPTPIRDIWLTAQLVKGTTKPTRCWIADGRSAPYVLEIYKAAAGGAEQLRERPQIEAFVEPISPLQMPTTGMEILLEFTRLGLPVSYGPMVQAGATGPATLAGTLVQENAETLAGIVITQVLNPGTPVMYGGIPHIIDMRTSLISFASPEQGLMAVAMTQIAKYYGLPVYVNAGLADSKLVDVQSGLEKGMNFLLGALAGADLVAHLGIAGPDQGASLTQLVVDNEMVAFVKRTLQGIRVDDEALALAVIGEVGHTGEHLCHPHTVAHFRDEMWMPRMWDRRNWDPWLQDGGRSMAELADQRVQDILQHHTPQPIDEALGREIDAIVESAKKHLL
jgi:trimethylamine--corrinoid protein Co-methyltransferase